MNLLNLKKIGSWPSLVQTWKKQLHHLPLTSRPSRIVMRMTNLMVNLCHYHNLNLKKKLRMVQLNIPGPCDRRPIFDFRRVFARLPRLAGTDDVTAKRLILGLHERLWHAGTQDVKAILIRCGMPHAVWRLTGDAASSCRICRKFSRAGRRPQYKGTNLSMSFNEVIQADLYSYDGKTYLLVIDEATRYKVATLCEGRELKHILGALMRCWIRYFPKAPRLKKTIDRLIF